MSHFNNYHSQLFQMANKSDLRKNVLRIPRQKQKQKLHL